MTNAIKSNTLYVTPRSGFVQEFTWSTDDGPVNLDGASIAVRWWQDGKNVMTSSSESGEVVIEDDGAFIVKLDEDKSELAAQCSVYDVFASIPGHGLTRVTKGSVQFQLEPSIETAIPSENE